ASSGRPPARSTPRPSLPRTAWALPSRPVAAPRPRGGDPRSRSQGQWQLLAVALDVGGRAGMVGGHDLDEGRAEFAPRPREFAVGPDRVGPPTGGGRAGRGAPPGAAFHGGGPAGGARGRPAPPPPVGRRG